MDKKALIKKRAQKLRRAGRTRSRIQGTADRPRLSVARTKKHISVQAIDDAAGVTLASAFDKTIAVEGKTPLEIAELVGKELGAKLKAAGITTAIYDRGSFLYHGRVKALAEGVRSEGIQF
ncbi:MAG: 50S ribosomal protein L18 [bacterium]|nr:50S ribosomal protein L18 [bacterium]